MEAALDTARLLTFFGWRLRAFFSCLFILLLAPFCVAQTPAVQSTMNFSLGAAAFGLAPTSSATSAADITLQLNPGFTGSYFKHFALLSDSLLSPAPSLQYYGGGGSAPIPDPFPASTVFSELNPYWRASIGAVLVGGQTHVGFMAGGGINYNGPSGLVVNLIEVDDCHFPGAPFGNNAPCVSGGLQWLFAKGSGATASARAARRAAKKQEHDWIHSEWSK